MPEPEEPFEAFKSTLTPEQIEEMLANERELEQHSFSLTLNLLQCAQICAALDTIFNKTQDVDVLMTLMHVVNSVSEYSEGLGKNE